MHVSGLLPRRMAVFGLVAGAFAFVAATGALFDIYDRQSAPQFLLTVPEMVWEMALGIYLVVKGFRSWAWGGAVRHLTWRERTLAFALGSG